MLRVLAVALMLMPSAASAQGALAEMMCWSKPTRGCILEMAIDYTRAAEGTSDQNLPWGRLIETASRYGRVDLAMGLLDRLDAGDTTAVADLIAGLTRDGRMTDVHAVLAGMGKKPGDYAFAIVPVLVDMQRRAELDAFIQENKPDAQQIDAFTIVGDLMAGRSDAALARLRKMPDAERDTVAALAVETLFSDGYAVQARPFMSMVGFDRTMLICQMAKELRDAAYADACLEGHKANPTEDLAYIVSNVLAATGRWREALEIADSMEDVYRASAYVDAATYSREDEALKVVNAKISEEPEVFQRERLMNLLIRALIFCDYGPVASEIIRDETDTHRKEALATIAAVATAELGNVQDAISISLSLADERRKAWALWEVASKLKE